MQDFNKNCFTIRRPEELASRRRLSKLIKKCGDDQGNCTARSPCDFARWSEKDCTVNRREKPCRTVAGSEFVDHIDPRCLNWLALSM